MFPIFKSPLFSRSPLYIRSPSPSPFPSPSPSSFSSCTYHFALHDHRPSLIAPFNYNLKFKSLIEFNSLCLGCAYFTRHFSALRIWCSSKYLFSSHSKVLCLHKRRLSLLPQHCFGGGILTWPIRDDWMNMTEPWQRWIFFFSLLVSLTWSNERWSSWRVTKPF